MKRILTITIIALLVAVAGWAVRADVMAGDAMYTTVTVENNDTLWTIAGNHVSDDVDIRAYIYEVQQLNHIEDPGHLVPGQTIKLPAR
jgi:LysM repeat protein